MGGATTAIRSMFAMSPTCMSVGSAAPDMAGERFIHPLGPDPDIADPSGNERLETLHSGQSPLVRYVVYHNLTTHARSLKHPEKVKDGGLRAHYSVASGACPPGKLA